MTDQKSSLLSLPTEILTLILSYCHESWDDDKESDLWSDPDENGRHHFSALCLTSRHLRSIALPMLYAVMYIPENQQEIIAFLRHMQKNPELAGLILYLRLSLPLSLCEPSLDQATSVPLPIIWPDKGSLGPPPFQNLVSITLCEAMVPLSMDRIPSEHFVFPALEECYFDYGGELDQMPYQKFHIASFLPFWISPRLTSFGIDGSGMHIIGSDRSNTPLDYRPSMRLTDLAKLVISCQIDATAVKELIAFRMTKHLVYKAPSEIREGCHFDNYARFLAPYIKDLTYFWNMDIRSTPESRRPDLSVFTVITSLELSAPVLANFSSESETFDRIELLCRLPLFLKHLKIRVEPREIHRRQFYELITRMVGKLLPDLSSLGLDFGIANCIIPDNFYWNNRLVSERERADRDVTDEILYGTNGQTVEHNRLRKVCQDSDVILQSQFVQNFQQDDQQIIHN